jgi:N-acetylglucosaminyldiphosphoundecaprenol N-acetyl-beta-D-mannosaminyltransferase
MGINVTGTNTGEVLARVSKLISDSTKFYIITPNPELILMAQDNTRLKNALNGTKLAIPDGIGLKIAIPDLNIIKGRELFLDLIKLAAKRNWKVYLLGGLGNEAELAAQKLKGKYTGVKLLADPGWKLDQNAKPISEVDGKLERETVEKINKFAPQLLFVAFGNPRQEIWIHENYLKLDIGGVMAVGGAFRYVAGLSMPTPRWMTSIGFEWLWRLLTEPNRLGRIFNAVIVFPFRVFLSKLNS